MYMRTKALPSFKAGDTVCVWVKIQEGTEKTVPKIPFAVFEGTVIRSAKSSTNATF